MRIKCEYKTESIPVAYNMMFLALIKESLKKTNEEYFKKLYYYDETKNNKKPKNFCFSVYMKNFIKKEEMFEIKDKAIFNISSPDYEFMLNVYNGLLNISEFKYKNHILNKVRISLVKEKQVNSNSVKFNTMSPICVKDKNNNSLEITDINYEKELNYIINKSLEGFRGYGLIQPVKFYPINMKKKVVKEDIRAFTEKTNKPFYYVNSYSGIFKLEGDIEDLQEIYSLGSGFKRGQGFGMLEIVQ